MEQVSLRDDQVADLAFYMRNKRCLNLSDPGTGKTPSVVVMQKWLWEHHGIGTVWSQPKKLLPKNRREILRFTGLDPDLVVIVDGTKKQVEKALETRAAIYLMGFRRFTMSWRDLPAHVRAMHIDELHMGYKNADSQASQAMFDFMRRRGEWYLAMTGTLVDGPLDSVYPAIRVIEPRYYSDKKMFLRQHAIKDWDDKIIGWKNHAKISKILGHHGIRRTFASIHGDVEVVPVPEVCGMSRRQRSIYDEFKDQALVELEQFYIDGTQPGVAFIRARQIMEHPEQFPDLRFPDEDRFVDITGGEPSGKMGLLEVHLEDHRRTGKPLLIFGVLKPQQRTIQAMLTEMGFRHALINGDTTAKEADRADRMFQAGELDVLLCSPACAAIGYNWQHLGRHELDHIIFMHLDYRDTTYLQAVQRAVRGPRQSPLRVSIFEYENSLDQRVAQIVWRKSRDANRVDPTRPVLQLSSYQEVFA